MIPNAIAIQTIFTDNDLPQLVVVNNLSLRVRSLTPPTMWIYCPRVMHRLITNQENEFVMPRMCGLKGVCSSVFEAISLCASDSIASWATQHSEHTRMPLIHYAYPKKSESKTVPSASSSKWRCFAECFLHTIAIELVWSHSASDIQAWYDELPPSERPNTTSSFGPTQQEMSTCIVNYITSRRFQGSFRSLVDLVCHESFRSLKLGIVVAFLGVKPEVIRHPDTTHVLVIIQASDHWWIPLGRLGSSGVRTHIPILNLPSPIDELASRATPVVI